MAQLMNRKQTLHVLRRTPGSTVFWINPDDGREWLVRELIEELKNQTPLSQQFREAFKLAWKDLQRQYS